MHVLARPHGGDELRLLSSRQAVPSYICSIAQIRKYHRADLSSRAPYFLAWSSFGFRCFIQCFWRNIGTVRPSNGGTIYEEFLKVILVAQRFEDWTIKPT